MMTLDKDKTSIPNSPFGGRDLTESSLAAEIVRSVLLMALIWSLSIVLLHFLPEDERVFAVSLLFAEFCVGLTLGTAYLCSWRSFKRHQEAAACAHVRSAAENRPSCADSSGLIPGLSHMDFSRTESSGFSRPVFENPMIQYDGAVSFQPEDILRPMVFDLSERPVNPSGSSSSEKTGQYPCCGPGIRISGL